MDFWSGLQIYLVVAAALAGTSYINLFRPAMQLLEEIMGRKMPWHRGWLGTSVWLISAFIFAPAVIFLLLNNDNDDFIEKFAVALANRIIKREEEEEE